MSTVNRERNSLEARTFRITITGAVVIGIVVLAIGLGLYTKDLVNQYIAEACSISNSAAAVLQSCVDVEPLSNEIMSAYRSGNVTEEFVYELTQREDYRIIHSVLEDFNGSADIDAIYMSMYDRDTSAKVYLVDPDDDINEVRPSGDYDLLGNDVVEHFLSWNGEGKLYKMERTKRYGWICTSGAPIRGGNGKVVAFVISDVSLANVSRGMKNFVLQYIIAIIILMNLIGYLLLKHMKKTLINPINDIAKAAQNYVKDRYAGIRDTNCFTMLNINTGDEVENLSNIMADMERDLAEYEKNFMRISAERERISTELALATRIQADMLPNIFPAFPNRPELDIYASMDPAKEVGGDFYDFFLIDDTHLGIVMADVSGKGVPAALFMMISKMLLQNYAMTGRSPAEVLKAVNNQVCANNREEMFVTVWFGILDTATGKITAANAGHEYPAVMHKGGMFKLVQDKHGLVIGGMEGISYKEYELTLTPGSKLFLYTDGVPEATNSCNEMFGTERMIAALNIKPDASSEVILHNVREAVDSFVKDAEQFDDLTMLCVEYKGVNL